MSSPLADPDVSVRLESPGPVDALMVETRFITDAAGVRYLESSVANVSNTDAHLDRITLEFPWLQNPDADTLIAAGGTTMVWPVKIFPANTPPERGSSGTYLQARQGSRYALVAIASWNVFWTELSYHAGHVRVSIHGDGRRLRPGEKVALETLLLSESDDWQQQLTDYAGDVARRLDLKLKPRRVFAGWSTWDYYGRTWTAQTVRDHLAVLRPIEPRVNMLQIDGGWWPRRGDYLDVRANLHAAGGMKGLAADIRRAGLEPGIHFDGGRGDNRASVYVKHPEYFLHDDTGQLLREAQMQATEQLQNIYFDYSHPGTQAYLREVTHTLRRDWGYDYIKIDFLWYNLDWAIRRTTRMDPARRILAHDPGTTSLERLRAGLRAYREGMGDDAWFLGCGAPFGPTYGFVDSLRTSFDIWPNVPQFRANVLANAGMFYIHERLAYNDADYQISRSREDQDVTLVPDKTKDAGDLTRNEVEMLANYIGLFSVGKFNSDNLTILREERRELFRRTVDLPYCRRFVPLDFWAHGRAREDAFHAMLGETPAGECYVAFFNWHDAPRTYRVGGVGPQAPLPVVGAGERAFADGEFVLTLPARHSAVFKFPRGADYEYLRRALTVQ